MHFHHTGEVKRPAPNPARSPDERRLEWTGTNNDPSLAFDKKRKQEMVAYAILFSLFERAYLMFSQQADTFRQRQWSGWKHFLSNC